MLPPIPIPRAPGNPVAGLDYPRTWEEFLAFFPDEPACAAYLERLSWPDGFLCSRCNRTGEPWRGSRRRLVCRSCGHETTVTAGTLFQGTRTPLRQWLAAAWHVSTAEQGVSARRLQRALGLGSYETAWTILHRLRRAMVRSGRPRLEGVVEVGRTVLAARLARGAAAEAGRPRRPPRAVVAIAVEDRGAEPGRVRMQRLASKSDQHLVRFIEWAVEPDAVIQVEGLRDAALLARLSSSVRPSDALVEAPTCAVAVAPAQPAFSGYPALSSNRSMTDQLGLTAGPVEGRPNHGLPLSRGPLAASAPPTAAGEAAPPRPALAHLREVELRLRRWVLGTHQGAISAELLDWYLDEFTFRFNRRSARHRGLLFYRLVEEALVTPPQTYGAVIGAAHRSAGTPRQPRPR